MAAIVLILILICIALIYGQLRRGLRYLCDIDHKLNCLMRHEGDASLQPGEITAAFAPAVAQINQLAPPTKEN